MKKTIAIILLSAALAGCAAENTPTAETSAEITTALSETSAETTAAAASETAAAETPRVKLPSFAERAVGRYWCNYNGGLGEERLKIEIADFGGNLYAFCSLGGDTDKPPEEDGDYAYSVWTAEIIPEVPGEFLTDNERCTAGVLKYSAMSNTGRFWGPPDTGSVVFTKDGIVFEGIDLVNNTADNGDMRTELKRYEGRSCFDTIAEETGALPDELLGLWRYSGDNGETEFLRFECDSTGNTVTRYRRDEGREAVFLRGNLSIDSSVIKPCCFAPGTEPYMPEWSYSLSGDTLTLTDTDGEDKLYERTDDSSIPLVTLADADEINGKYTNMTITDADGNKRFLTLQFRMSDDVENNGGYFVRVGSLIFYREYDPDICGKNYSYGNFLYDIPAEHGSPVYCYDTRTGKTEIAFDDNGFGPVYYMNGMFYTCTGTYFYSEMADLADEDTGRYSQHFRRCWPDGSASEDAGNAASISDIRSFLDTSVYVMGVSDDSSYMLIREYCPLDEIIDASHAYQSRYYMYDGSSFTQEITVGDTESLDGWALRSSDMLTVKYDWSDERFIFSQYSKDGEETILGTAQYEGEAAEYGVCISDQILYDGDDIYFSVAGLIGDVGYPDGYMIYKAQSGKENSLEEVWHGLPDGYEDHLPSMSIDRGDIVFSEHPEGWTGLSENTYGDLVRMGVYGEEVLIKDYEAKDIYEMYGYHIEPGDTVRVLEAAEYVDNAVYIIEADCVYSPDYDSGIIYDYTVQKVRWIRIAEGQQEVISEISLQ